jgi:adenylosuccinate lyase
VHAKHVGDYPTHFSEAQSAAHREAKMEADFSTYLSPFTWRYGSEQMRRIWSEVNKRKLWRWIWVALAEVQAEFGLLASAQVDDLRAHMEEVDLTRSLQIEAELRHDLMAELKTYAEQCRVGGGALHLGMTSMDVVDNADVLRVRESLGLLLVKLETLLLAFAEQVERWADTVVMGFTHLQPAEPTTLGYRLAQYAQDLWGDWENLSRVRDQLKGKGIRGAVGTGASFADLLGEANLSRFQDRLSELLDLPFFLITTQTYPRKQDYQVLSALAGMGASLYRFGFDLRLLQSPQVGELAEPFEARQVGSSAMPFKRNPVQAEKMDSLARWLAQFPRVAWDNAAHSLLERTLDDSANRRSHLPEAFLIADELLVVALRLVTGLGVDECAIRRNLESHAPFAALERVLMALSRAGADRQEMHARLRDHALAAWEAIQRGEPNPLASRIPQDEAFRRYLSPQRLEGLFQVRDYVGDAPQRARALAEGMRASLAGRTSD